MAAKKNLTERLITVFFGESLVLKGLILLRSISSGSEIYNPLLEMLATFGAEII